ncbi:MAG: methylenetetrahydrofolate reductase C-terminal domain-containing protein, partial [Dehalococcoidales bacterium]|nr:methylenetetrahydrofolate reductase C-terminal domain-containing protein [Dehalococcoidales bacterium]
MKSITKQKPFDEVQQQLDRFDRVYIVGCGTCTTTTRTGGREEVLDMKERLQELGKLVTGWTVIPTACDEMTEVSMKENSGDIQNANCILIMACALGVHRVNLYSGKPVIPAVDTLFIGIEDSPGNFYEVCAQCGQCVLGETAGICPLTACHKGLLNGPCGGTNNGKCEVDAEK